MGNLALLARELGFHVTGSDSNAYPPMRDLLRDQNIPCATHYSGDNLSPVPDTVLVGNTISRTNPEVEALLNLGIHYTSGAQWLCENVLINKKVICVAGTHGKSTTSSMISWILEYAGLNPGYLVGGVPQNFQISSRIGTGEWFVVEGDEYDTAFFDKRSKFVHYRPLVALLLNLEFDHADIFDSIEEIETQFQYFLRTVPSSGHLIVNSESERLMDITSRISWTPVNTFSAAGNRNSDFYISENTEDYQRFKISSLSHGSRNIEWNVPGQHNAANALAAISGALCVGVEFDKAVEAIQNYIPVKRRLELLSDAQNIRIYDDFAHHPTAMKSSLDAVSKSDHPSRLIAVFEPRSNTMRMGIHGDAALFDALEMADLIYMYRAPNVHWNPQSDRKGFFIYESVDILLDDLVGELSAGDSVIIMSNGDFNELHHRLIREIESRERSLKPLNLETG